MSDTGFQSSEFQDFIAENSRFWRKYSPDPKSLGDKYLIVDFYNEEPPQLMTSAILAKIMQMKYGYRLIAITSRGEAAAPYRTLARSYGINITLDASEIGFPENPLNITDMVRKVLMHDDPADIRKNLLELTIDGLHIGELIYDCYLRDHNLPTIDSPTQQLFDYFVWAMRYFDMCKWLFEQYDIAGYITSHHVYIVYGILCRMTAANGGDVFTRTRRFPLIIMRKFQDLETVKRGVTIITKEEIDLIESTLGDRAVEDAKKALQKRFKGEEEEEITYASSYSQKHRRLSKEEMLSELGLDPEKPLVFIMNQVLPEAHMYHGYIFEDHLEWLRETCKVAMEMDHVNWVIRDHPLSEFYTSNLTTADLLKEFIDGSSNIRMCPADLSGESLNQMVDSVVGSGLVTVELACFGVPSISPLVNDLAVHGCCHHAKTKEKYFELLRKVDTLPRLEEWQIRIAHIITYTLLCNIIPTKMVPFQKEGHFGIDVPARFREATEALKSVDLYSDPLYRNFTYLLDNGLERLLPFDTMGLLNGDSKVTIGKS